jgi:hypothetical protein
MNQTMIDTPRQDPNPDRAPGPLGEASPEDALELAYKARMRAVLHGAATDQVATAQMLVRLERLCLERRQLHRLVGVADIDPSYYLG